MQNKIIQFLTKNGKLILTRLAIILLNVIELVLVFIPTKRASLAPAIKWLEDLNEKL